jgi:transcriptional regulator with XRE-family HTH domain
MSDSMIIPAQIRAGRALLGWSQELLAEEAEVALSTVRDTENERRAADTAAVRNIRRALWNGGVVFAPGRQGEGPGVRLVANRPNLVRRPTIVQIFEGMPFTVEWQGRIVTVFIALEVIEDLGGHGGKTPDEAYLKTFERHRGEILDAVTLAINDAENFDRLGRLLIRQKDIDALKKRPWYRVSIDCGEDIRAASISRLMDKFVSLFIDSGLPNDVQVFHGTTEKPADVFYFSTKAATIAKNLLSTFGAIPCAATPNTGSMKKIRL